MYLRIMHTLIISVLAFILSNARELRNNLYVASLIAEKKLRNVLVFAISLCAKNICIISNTSIILLYQGEMTGVSPV